jgi:hypothetical protein
VSDYRWLVGPTVDVPPACATFASGKKLKVDGNLMRPGLGWRKLLRWWWCLPGTTRGDQNEIGHHSVRPFGGAPWNVERRARKLLENLLEKVSPKLLIYCLDRLIIRQCSNDERDFIVPVLKSEFI